MSHSCVNLCKVFIFPVLSCSGSMLCVSMCHINLVVGNTALNLSHRCTSTEGMVIPNQLHWAGHVLRMADYQLSKQVPLCQLNKETRIHKGGKRNASRIISRPSSRNVTSITTTGRSLLKTGIPGGRSCLRTQGTSRM